MWISLPSILHGFAQVQGALLVRDPDWRASLFLSGYWGPAEIEPAANLAEGILTCVVHGGTSAWTTVHTMFC